MRAALCALALSLAASCGYHTAGRADLIPKTVHSVAIPAFSNLTTRYKLTDRLPEAIAREFISRTRYQIVSDPARADAVLQGSVNNYFVFPTVLAAGTGGASVYEMHVYLQISFVERTTGKVLFTRPNFEVRERYQISTTETAYFEESEPAIERASRQTARQVVSAILENF